MTSHIRFHQSIAALALLLTAGAALANPCLVTPAELKAATGRDFTDGEAGKDITGQYEQCAYAEKAKPTRKLIVSIRNDKAKEQYEASKRLLHFGNESIDLANVGDAAYFSGVAAGVMKGDRAILVSGVRRASDPKIEREKVAELLRAALKRAGV